MGAVEWTVVVLVVAGRLGIPLLIPYFPVPALISCLVLDAVDQSIFQQFPAIPLGGYQSYDKALDIYYLSIAYLSTLRNWTNQTAFHMSQFLFYYRMLGAVLFEITQARAVLFIFPNTFEYFFLFVEIVRMRWDTGRMGRWTVVLAAAAIWLFIKLPQEWWIHIAQLDMTDFIKESLFRVDATDGWLTAVAERPWVLVAMVVALVVGVTILYLVVRLKAPPFDHGLLIAADPLPAGLRGAEPYRRVRAETRIWTRQLYEKVALAGLLSVIFGLMLTGGEASALRIAVGAAIFTVTNAGVSHAMAMRGRNWRLLGGELATMLLVNLVILFVLEALDRYLGVREARVPFVMTLFFSYLLTLVIVLYDRYHVVFQARRLFGRGAAVALATTGGDDPGNTGEGVAPA